MNTKRSRGGNKGLIKQIVSIIKDELYNTGIFELFGNISHTAAVGMNFPTIQTTINRIKQELATSNGNVLNDNLLDDYKTLVDTFVEIASHHPDKYKTMLRRISTIIYQDDQIQKHRVLLNQLARPTTRDKLVDIVNSLEGLEPYLEGKSRDVFVGLCDLMTNTLSNDVFDEFGENARTEDLRDTWKQVHSLTKKNSCGKKLASSCNSTAAYGSSIRLHPSSTRKLSRRPNR
jgi:hypothetical protein